MSDGVRGVAGSTRRWLLAVLFLLVPQVYAAPPADPRETLQRAGEALLQAADSHGIEVRVAGISAFRDARAKATIQLPDAFAFQVTNDGRQWELGNFGNHLWLQFSEHEARIATRTVEEPLLKSLSAEQARNVLTLLTHLCTIEEVSDHASNTLRLTLPTLISQALGETLVQLDVTMDVSGFPEAVIVTGREGRLASVGVTPLKAEADAFQIPTGAAAGYDEIASFFRIAADRLLHPQDFGQVERLEDGFVARHGKGRLEIQQGQRIAYLVGSPAEMGEQHGSLLGPEARLLVRRILYGVGVGSSFAEGRWFLDDIRGAWDRLEPFVPPAVVEETEALARAAGLSVEEVRLANVFPELFHCSGFALWGQASRANGMYHGRILDYLRGFGLEPAATVFVNVPDGKHAWVNLGYAGFVGTVTAMNERGIAVGEMGGKGLGDWDGVPMAQLIRLVMEEADSLDEALQIMRDAPRTCEYYYVISDGRAMRAAAVYATPERFDVLYDDEAHPRLDRPMDDVVAMSQGKRYDRLTEQISTHYGKLDAESAWSLMRRPVAMNSNIQTAMFMPDRLEFWIANATVKDVASNVPPARFNLADLLEKARGLPSGALAAPPQ